MRPTSRNAILEAAFDLLGRRPASTLADIADHAGVGRATLHRHFSSREVLVTELTRIAIDEVNAAVDEACKHAESHSDGLRRMLEAILPLGARHGFLATEPVGNDPEIAALMQRDADSLRTEIDAAKREGLFAQDVPTDWIVECFDALIYTGWRSVRLKQATPDQAAALAWRTLTSGLSALSESGLD
ncbi:MAG: helix-turn-helix domain-containing protein [Pseudomonadota bacterium]